MADEGLPLQRQMSLIPYPYQGGEVVLRRGNAVVVYDAQSQQLSVQDASEPTVDPNECPYCHQTLRHDTYGPEQSTEDHRGRTPRAWVDPDYFRVLAEGQKRSRSPSADPSAALWGFNQPALRSGRSRDPSGAQDPPQDAEFIGSEPSASARQGISTSAFSPGFFRQFFKEIGPLGKGGNGVVLLVEHVLDKVSLGHFACKRIPVGDDHAWLEKVLVEVTLLQKVSHPNLVAYHWVWLESHQPSKFGPSIPCLWMLQQYCNGGDLHHHVLGSSDDEQNMKEKLKNKMRRRSKGEAETPSMLRGSRRLNFEEIYSFFRDITTGLHHLHTQGYIHRDLKPANCLLQNEGARTRVLISDFGEVQAADAERISTGATGTISYCAPEVLRRNPSDGSLGHFTTKSDIFSLGMIVYFMCFSRLPYKNTDDINEENEDMDELRGEIMRWSGFDDQLRARSDLPEKLYKYLKRLLSVDPNERPSTEEILISIKGGVGLGDAGSAGSEDNSPRISSIDTPKSRSTRRQPPLTRPVPSGFRHNSFDNSRPMSPVRRTSDSTPFQSHSNSRPSSPRTDSSLMTRSRKINLPPPTMTDPLPSPELPPQSPRLMLPPPPSNNFQALLAQPLTLTVFRFVLFAVKVLTLTLPCRPYATSTWLLYPLIALATLDIAIWELDLLREAVLLGLHFAAIWLASREGRACETIIWGQF